MSFPFFVCRLQISFAVEQLDGTAYIRKHFCALVTDGVYPVGQWLRRVAKTLSIENVIDKMIKISIMIDIAEDRNEVNDEDEEKGNEL